MYYLRYKMKKKINQSVNQLAPPPYPSPKGRGVITEIPLVDNMRVYELTDCLVRWELSLFLQAIYKYTVHFTPLPLGEG